MKKGSRNQNEAFKNDDEDEEDGDTGESERAWGDILGERNEEAKNIRKSLHH